MATAAADDAPEGLAAEAAAAEACTESWGCTNMP